MFDKIFIVYFSPAEKKFRNVFKKKIVKNKICMRKDKQNFVHFVNFRSSLLVFNLPFHLSFDKQPQTTINYTAHLSPASRGRFSPFLFSEYNGNKKHSEVFKVQLRI